MTEKTVKSEPFTYSRYDVQKQVSITEFLNVSTNDISVQKALGMGNCPMHWRLHNSIPDLKIVAQFSKAKSSPGIVNCSPGWESKGKDKLSQLRTTDPEAKERLKI